MAPPDRPGDSDDDPSDEIIDLVDPSMGAIAQVIDLRTPGAPYTYPSSPPSPPDEEAATGPSRSDAGMFGVARGSADVRTAPPDYD